MAIYYSVAFCLMVLILVQTVFFLVASSRYFRKRSWVPDPAAAPDVLDSGDLPTVSILVPAYNEEQTLSNCLDSLAAQTYPKVEVLVISDGSTDATLEVAQGYASRIPHLRALSKPNGGKASALNFGLLTAEGEISMTVDADSVLAPDAVERLVGSFASPEVVAVAGNVRIANRRTLLGRQQAAEYMTGLALMRTSFAEIGAVQVIPGAIGAFRTDALRQVGGYSDDTLVEDMDVTISLGAAGGQIVYNPEALAYTEGPTSYRDVYRQRLRWTRGGFQALGKHKGLVFTRGGGGLGWIGLPYFMVAPWLDVLVTGFLTLTIALLAVGMLPAPWMLLAVGILVPIALAGYSAILDHESLSLAPFYAVMSYVLKPLLVFVTLRAGAQWLHGVDSGWVKLERSGSNVLPDAASAPADQDRSELPGAASDTSLVVLGSDVGDGGRLVWGGASRLSGDV